ncbi:unnamed protein product [Ilex paraguariensis]|uniref:Transmembrane protein n=1 Tax=Ilex paraguariensis TaxID=185542 RepID=A0ABC8RL44_9AQUA
MSSLMEHMLLREREFAVDLESGRTANEEVGGPGPTSNAKLEEAVSTKVCSVFVDVGESSKNGVNLDSNLKNGSEASPEIIKSLMDKKVEGVVAANQAEEKTGKSKRKSTSAKKPPKPPRPPRGLSLDAADERLIKEIAELAMIKRARIKRMKALKKMKAAKASSPNGNLLATLFTMIFCLVIIFQGASSRCSSPVSSHGPPELAGGEENGFALIHGFQDTSIPVSGPPNLAEGVSGLDTEGKAGRAVG